MVCGYLATLLFLQGVLQISIRQQNTKSKAGTLPLYAYQKQKPVESDINLLGMLIGGVQEDAEEPEELTPLLLSIGGFVKIDIYNAELHLQPDCSMCLGKVTKPFHHGDRMIKCYSLHQ